MAKGITFTQVGQLLSKAVRKGSIQQQVAQEGISGARQISKEVFGYDFVNLLVKLLIYFVAAFIFAKFMEAVIFLNDPLKSAVFKSLFGLLGLLIPSPDIFPDTLKKLFDSGVGGFKYWDIIKIMAILLVIAEAFRYVNTQKELGGKSSPMTLGVFTLLISVLGITTVPELIQRLKLTDFNIASMK